MGTPTNLTNISQALIGDTSGNLTATVTQTLGNNTKRLATMEALQSGLRNIRAITGTVTLAYADHGVALVDASGGNVTINLPAATTNVVYRFRRIDSSTNTVTINRAGTDTIEGLTSVIMVGSSAYRELISDGVSKWYASVINEQGTFTPVARGTGVTGAFTYTAQSGSWNRISNRVFFQINIGWSASTATGSLRIKLNDIPYAVAAGQQVAVAIRTAGLVIGTGTGQIIQGYVNTTLQEIQLEAYDPNGNNPTDIVIDTAVGQLMFAGSYLTT